MLNPVTSPFFWPLTGAVGGFLAIALVYTLFQARKDLGQLHKNSLFHRWASSAVLAPLAMLCLLCGTVTVTVMSVVLAVVGMLEFFRVVRLSKLFIPPALAAGAAVPILAAAAPQLVLPVFVAALLTFGAIAVFAFRNAPESAADSDGNSFMLQQAAFALLAVAYSPLLGSYIIHLSRLNGGTGILLALIAAIGLSDTLAFVCGKAFGRRKLSPHVSPNKTIAGAVGNVIGAYVGFLSLQFACLHIPLPVLVLLPLLIAAAAVIGDLFESVVKRSFKVKDAGTWLPGFGGLLDRVDSLLFVMPLSYYVLAAAL